MEELEAQRSRHRLQRTIQGHAQRLCIGKLRHHLDVGHGGPRFEILAIARGERRPKVPEQRVSARFTQRLDERVLEVVFPAPRRCNQPRFYRANVVFGDATRCRAHRDHHARERRFGKMDVELRAAAPEGLRQDGLPFLPQLGRVILARRVDQAGQETLERIAAHEQTQPLPVLEVKDRLRGA